MNLCYAAARGRSIGLVLLIVLAGAAARAGDRGIVCVLVPHFKDEYWLTVGWGLEQEAADTGLALRMHEAGGYRARDAQIAQIDACVADGAAAILLGAVSADHPDLLAAVARAASRVPVFGLVNALEAPGLAGRVGVDWREMGAAVGRELAARYPPGGVAAQAVLVSGPAESGWAGPLEAGLRDGLGDSALRIVAVLSADTGLREQFASTAAALQPIPTWMC